VKKIILSLIVLFISQSAFTQKIILHRNTGGDQTFFLSSVDSVTFLPFACGDEIRYEGKTYGTVLIGTQCWMKENLDVGTMINGWSNQTNNGIIEKYCYNDDSSNCTTYGGLYQWNEAMQYVTTEGAQGICPTGWHIPTLGEFQTLAVAVGNDGNALKAIGQGSGSGAGTNTSGFSALLAGYRNYNSNFYYLGSYTNFVSSTEVDGNYALTLDLRGIDSGIRLYSDPKEYGFSLRCIKN
jgi:uncharacterized protein (TIGR02145 family)